MKKLLIFLGVIIVLFGGLYVVNQQSQKAKNAEFKDNIYGVDPSKLHPETVKILKDPNYSQTILPAELDKKIANKESFFVYFYASTCVHCKATTPKLAPMEKDMGANMVMINLEEYRKGFQQYNIEFTPTLVAYKDGAPVDKMVGGVPEKDGGEGNTLEMFKKFFEKYKV
ncbi:thioredoxin family protein [Paenibacillus sp. N1-5-1-14]|uniref:thioredoxin family protein n=1 Tax=Paenibacillus radicibacter TaxID=2972488 RepID=UPI002158AEF7|nr:thioredoxin family protein [Paenibacillus radicibacter]MCR8643909.1 thioredoxin family protein [Paenibacillus radicibacter]